MMDITWGMWRASCTGMGELHLHKKRRCIGRKNYMICMVGELNREEELLHPRAYPMCHMFICTYILPYTSCIVLMCTTGLPCRSYRTFPLSQYLAALDLLTHHGLPAYSGHTFHACAAPSTHTYLYCFWHVWVISTAMTSISFAAYSVQYCASVSPSPAFWRVFLALYDLYFTWLLVTRYYLYILYSVCTDLSRFRLGLPCNPRTINHSLELCF